MCWGFECPDEWFDAMWELSEKLQTMMVKENIVIHKRKSKR
jgi:hypothetical protein